MNSDATLQTHGTRNFTDGRRRRDPFSVVRLLVALTPFLFFARNVIWAIVTGDPAFHNDSKVYFSGYLAGLNSDLDFSAIFSHYGHMPEIALPIIYYISSLIYVCDSERELLILNAVVFSALYVGAISLTLYRVDVNGVIRSRYGTLSKFWFVILLNMCPPGAALQTTRQAVAIAAGILLTSYILKRWSTFRWFLVIALTSLFHIGSMAVVAIIAGVVKRRISPTFVLGLVGLASVVASFDIVNLALSLNYAEFRYTENYISLSPIMVLNACLLACLIPKRNRTDLPRVQLLAIAALILWLGYDYQFFIRRVFFGMDFFLLPMLLLNLISGRKRPSVTAVAFATNLIFFAANSAIIYSVAIA